MVDPDATERMEEEIKNETEEDLYKNDDTPLDDEEVSPLAATNCVLDRLRKQRF